VCACPMPPQSTGKSISASTSATSTSFSSTKPWRRLFVCTLVMSPTSWNYSDLTPFWQKRTRVNASKAEKRTLSERRNFLTLCLTVFFMHRLQRRERFGDVFLSGELREKDTAHSSLPVDNVRHASREPESRRHTVTLSDYAIR